MNRNRLALLAIVFEASVLLFGNGMIGLFESSEARYAEVSREMIETGDFLSPQMDYVYHFTKPPFAYWMTSLGMAIFGVNPFGARFFVTFFASLTMLLVFLIGREESDDGGIFPLLVLGASPMFFVMAKVLTTDIYVTFFVTLGVYLFNLLEKEKLTGVQFDLLFGACCALAILTKGQVPLLYWALIFGGMAMFRRDIGLLKPFLSPLFLVTALALSGWWFAVVGAKHPGLLRYLFLRESIEASYSASRFHPGPLFYYIPVMIGAIFPFWMLLPAPRRLFNDPACSRYVGYTVFPLFLFSVFPAKLPTYLLPSLPGWALLLACSSRASGKRLRLMPLAAGTVLAGALSFIALRSERYVQADFTDVYVILSVSIVLAFISACFAFRDRADATLAALFVAILMSGLAAPCIVAKAPEKFKIAEKTALAMKEKMSPDDKVLELRMTAFSIPFYLERKVFAFENNFFRKKFLAEKPPHILQGEEELKNFMDENPMVWIVADAKSEKFLLEKYPGSRLFLKGERYIVFVSPGLSDRISR